MGGEVHSILFLVRKSLLTSFMLTYSLLHRNKSIPWAPACVLYGLGKELLLQRLVVGMQVCIFFCIPLLPSKMVLKYLCPGILPSEERAVGIAGHKHIPARKGFCIIKKGSGYLHIPSTLAHLDASSICLLTDSMSIFGWRISASMSDMSAQL